MQFNSVKSLDVVLLQEIKNGATIFQGAHPSSPLKSILEKNSAIKPHFMDLREQAAIIEYRREDQVISLETGISFASLAALLAENGQYLPCCVRDDFSLLEIINCGETGYFEHAFGLRALVLGLEILLASGETIHTGGKVVKNVTGYDLTKLFLGARGTLGVPTKAHLRLFAQPECSETFIACKLEFEELLLLAGNLIKSGLPLAGLEIVRGDFVTEKVASLLAKADLELPFTASEQSPSLLLITLAEHSEVMSELVHQVQGHCAKQQAATVRTEGQTQKLLMQSLEENFDLSITLLSAAFSRKHCSQVYRELKGIGQFDLLYRPGTGKLKLKLPTEQSLLEAIGLLRLMAAAEGPIDISYCNHEYEWAMERLPAPDPDLDRIKQQLKERFDPQKKMNPLAKL